MIDGPGRPQSALRLRMVLALIGVVLFLLLAVLVSTMDVPAALVVVPIALALVGVFDLGVVVNRLRRER
ncbi:DUF6343 family protein [Kribbella sancticallisti]